MIGGGPTQEVEEPTGSHLLKPAIKDCVFPAQVQHPERPSLAWCVCLQQTLRSARHYRHWRTLLYAMTLDLGSSGPVLILVLTPNHLAIGTYDQTQRPWLECQHSHGCPDGSQARVAVRVWPARRLRERAF